MKFETMNGTVRIAILIPSKGRAETLRKRLQRNPWLDDASVYIGVEGRERREYEALENEFPNISWMDYDNPTGSIGVAREYLRAEAMTHGKFDYVVPTDDNAEFSLNSLAALVRCAHEFPTESKSGTVSHGYHAIQKFFQQGKEGKRLHESVVHTIRSYEGVSHIYWCIPAKLYKKYQYPADCFTYDDRHLSFWLLSLPAPPTMRVCVDAEFSKTRHKVGGSGSLEERLVKCGKSLIPLARDFPLFMGSDGVNVVRWKFIMKLSQGFMYEKRPPRGSRQSAEAALAAMVPRSTHPIK